MKEKIYLPKLTKTYINRCINLMGSKLINYPLFDKLLIKTTKTVEHIEQKPTDGDFLDMTLKKQDKDFYEVNNDYLDSLDIEEIQDLLLYLDKLVIEVIPEPLRIEKIRKIESNPMNFPFQWFEYLFYTKELKKIKIDKESSIFLMDTQYIIEPRLIKNLLFFTVDIIKSKDLVIGEEHQEMGFHIHYAIKENKKNKRTKLLLLFNPKELIEVKNKKYTLYSEEHGGDKYLSIDIDGIGKNKRKDIYYACIKAVEESSIRNFRNLSKKSKLFYP